MRDELAIEQVEKLPLSIKPILICDIDEVVLHLVEPFSDVLAEMGFYLKFQGFRLSGNVYHKQTEAEAKPEDIRLALNTLFVEQKHRQGPVAGAVDALNTLSKDLEIIFLTNMPHDYSTHRRALLDNLGLDFPMITNLGHKGPVVEMIVSKTVHPIGFIDDTPHNLQSVFDTTPDVKLFHFMANDDFRALAKITVPVEISTGDWASAQNVIRKTLVK